MEFEFFWGVNVEVILFSNEVMELFVIWEISFENFVVKK